MRTYMRYLTLSLFFFVQLFSADTVQIVPVEPTPFSKTVLLRLAYPKDGQVLSKNPVWIQFRLDGYALGAASQFPRSKEVGVSSLGQTVHVVIDDHPYFAINEPAIDPLTEEGYYYDTSYKCEIPFSLSEGFHWVRLFPARAYGESLKSPQVFREGFFYVGKETKEMPLNLQGPYLTYNEPSNQIPLRESQPILLDFYISNCELSQDGYKVRLAIDKKFITDLTSWQPYYIYGLTKGSHTVSLSLLDPKGKVVPGSFNTVERKISVSK